MEITYIYGLLDPDLGKIRYVGATVNPPQRFRAHLAPETGYRPRGGVSAKSEWIAELKAQGSEPELVILEEVEGRAQGTGKPHPAVKEAEEWWMVRLIREGHPLTNSQLPRQKIKSDEEIMREALERGREMFGGQLDDA